jgi:hypothetical protein
MKRAPIKKTDLPARRIGNKVAGHLCAVCNKRTGEDTYGFRETLRANGILGNKVPPSLRAEVPEPEGERGFGMSELVAYMALCAKHGSKTSAFLLEHGQFFKIGPDTFKGRRGRQGHCYSNATHKALATDLTYCEGQMLIMGLPIDHGWCVTPEGIVVDPTVDNKDGRITEYFGVPFSQEYLIEAMHLNGVYGVLGYFSKTSRLLMDGKTSNFKATIGAHTDATN